ncbi:phosphoglycerate kinase, cytosolic-like [Miscanthus floridulus]|uniref:phosphoglycerate kinase, cytosolic-like n=1 Tax=Miscanthus floridulus TaxID=154761 RepID=UPI00345B1CF1
MASKKSVGNLTEADLKGKKVFLRADLNVPLDDDQNITDDTCIRASVPTIKFFTEKGAKVILASHPGRRNGVTPKFSLKPLVPRLSELLEVDVAMANDCIAEDLQQLAASLPDGGVLLLETARFYEEEEKNDPEFAKKLASVADICVNVDFAHGGALLEGEGLPGVFAFDIDDGFTTVSGIKNGLPDKTSHRISTDDGVSSELPVGTSRRTLPAGVFAYEITSEDKKVIHHISSDGGRRASTKVQEGKGLPGVFDWSGEAGSVVAGESRVEDKYIEHI